MDGPELPGNAGALNAYAIPGRGVRRARRRSSALSCADDLLGKRRGGKEQNREQAHGIGHRRQVGIEVNIGMCGTCSATAPMITALALEISSPFATSPAEDKVGEGERAPAQNHIEARLRKSRAVRADQDASHTGATASAPRSLVVG